MSGDTSNITTACITLASGVISAFIANILNARRSNAEKLWELRRAAYGTILAELKQVELVIDRADEYIQEDLHRYYDSEVSIRHNQKISHRMALAQASYQDNYLILSDQFIILFENLLRSFEGVEYLLPPEIHDAISKAIRTTRPKLAQQGRNEMPIQRNLCSWLCCKKKQE